MVQMISKYSKLQGVTYRWIESGEADAGLIAPRVESIKTLNAENQELRSRLRAIEEKLDLKREK